MWWCVSSLFPPSPHCRADGNIAFGFLFQNRLWWSHLAYGHCFKTCSYSPDLSGLTLHSWPHVKLQFESYEGRAHPTASGGSDPNVAMTFWSFENDCTSAFNWWQTRALKGSHEKRFPTSALQNVLPTHLHWRCSVSCAIEGPSLESVCWEVGAVQGKAGKPHVTGGRAGAFRPLIVGFVRMCSVCVGSVCVCVCVFRGMAVSWEWWAYSCTSSQQSHESTEEWIAPPNG